MFRTGILSSGNSGRYRKGASLALFAAALFLLGTIATAQSKEAMHSRMLDLARQMDAMKPSLASNPVNAFAWSQLMDEYRAISVTLGGDDPAKAMPGAGAAPSAPTGSLAALPPACWSSVFNFTNSTPLAVPTGPAVVTSQIVVSNMGPVLYDLNVTTFLTHTFAADLDITLTSPAGTVVTLTTDNGGVNDNVFNGTHWDDQGNLLGQVPYVSNDGVVSDHAYVNLTLASPLVPEEALGAFRGQNPNGTWTLTISDDLAGDGGSLDSWTLEVDALTSSPPQTAWTYFNNTPVPVPTGPAVVSSTINFPHDASVCGVRIQTALEHSFAADLDITLMSPDGTISTMTTDNGGLNDNVFAGTIFEDVANPAGQVPYVNNDGVTTDHLYVNLTAASPLVPEEAMGAFLGEQANGTWTLTISDDLAGDGGTLQAWGLQVIACGCVRPARPQRADARPSSGISNNNGVAEPFETFGLETTQRNAGATFTENFDTLYPSSLPVPWTETLFVGLAGDSPWKSASGAAASVPNVAFAPDPSHVTDSLLDTPPMIVSHSGPFFEFTHFINMEDTFDGGVLEVSVGGGPFQDILTAGASFLAGQYTDTISNCCSSPIAGRQAWSGNSAGFVRTVVILPPAMVGQVVVFRFRAATDTTVAGAGWRIDNVAMGGLPDAPTTGQMTDFTGPAGPFYAISDSSADYGTILPAAGNNCFNATGDCYELSVTGPRPATHWDALGIERLNHGTAFVQPVHIGASFSDVALANPYYRFIETMLHLGVTSGCGGPNYCPTFSVLREQMAVFLLIAKFGASYTPPPCAVQMFNDVPCSSVYSPFINEMVALGITSGCGGGNFCPTGAVLREQMAVFLLVALEGSGYLPPACSTPLFNDVPCASVYSRFVNELFRRGVTSGCGGGNYCPSDPVSREQMAVFLAATFSLHLY